jgi:hypothetical protein
MICLIYSLRRRKGGKEETDGKVRQDETVVETLLKRTTTLYTIKNEREFDVSA